jgi:hypothetical protein
MLALETQFLGWPLLKLFEFCSAKTAFKGYAGLIFGQNMPVMIELELGFPGHTTISKPGIF